MAAGRRIGGRTPVASSRAAGAQDPPTPGWRYFGENFTITELELLLLERPPREWTIDRVNRVSYGKDVAASELAALAECQWLADGWRTWAGKRAVEAGGADLETLER